MRHKIYEMKLFEEYVTESLFIVRVPGGWLINKCFVPFHNEFMDNTTSEEYLLENLREK
jgi:hypothetical protein